MRIITVEELKKRQDAGENLNIIDVREPHEYAEDNIGARLIPLGKVQTMQVEEIEDLKNEELIVHCKSGQRSMMACIVLEQLGFKDTRNLAGGITEYRAKFGK